MSEFVFPSGVPKFAGYRSGSRYFSGDSGACSGRLSMDRRGGDYLVEYLLIILPPPPPLSPGSSFRPKLESKQKSIQVQVSTCGPSHHCASRNAVRGLAEAPAVVVAEHSKNAHAALRAHGSELDGGGQPDRQLPGEEPFRDSCSAGRLQASAVHLASSFTVPDQTKFASLTPCPPIHPEPPVHLQAIHRSMHGPSCQLISPSHKRSSRSEFVYKRLRSHPEGVDLCVELVGACFAAHADCAVHACPAVTVAACIQRRAASKDSLLPLPSTVGRPTAPGSRHVRCRYMPTARIWRALCAQPEDRISWALKGHRPCAARWRIEFRRQTMRSLLGRQEPLLHSDA